MTRLRALDTAVGPVKKRERGFGAGELSPGQHRVDVGALLAAAMAAWLHQLTATALGEDIIHGHGVRGGKAMIAPCAGG